MYFAKNDLRRKGVILLIVLTLFAVVSILSLGIAAMGLTGLTETQNADKRIRAHYLAMSGIEIARGVLDNLNTRNMRGIFFGELSPDNLTIASLYFEDASALDENFTFDNLKDFLVDHTLPEEANVLFGITQNSQHVIKIVSLGCLNDVRKSVTLTLVPIGVFDMAIFGVEFVDIGGQGSVNGKVGTNSTDDNKIKFSNNTSLDGTVCIIDPKKNADVVNAYFDPVLEDLEKPRDCELPQFPDFQTIVDIYIDNGDTNTINKDSGFNKITTTPGGQLIIDTTGKQDIVIRCVDLKSLGKIIIKGDGIVWLYVSGTINLDDVVSTDDGSLILVYSGTSQISMTGQIQANSFGLYCPKANADLGGQMNLAGAVIAKEAKISGDADAGYDFFTYAQIFSELAFPISGGGNSRYEEVWSE